LRSLKAMFIDACNRQHGFMCDPRYDRKIAPGSTPTLFFGSQGIPERPVRVLTVGYNPSAGEFNRYACLASSGRGLDIGSLDACKAYEAEVAIEKMRQYFEERRRLNESGEHPWSGFFRSFEELLAPLSASFFRGRRRFLAAHADVLTPFASRSIRDLAYLPVLEYGRECFREVLEHFPDLHLVLGIGDRTRAAFQKIFGGIERLKSELPGVYAASTELSGHRIVVVCGDEWFRYGFAPFAGIDVRLVAQEIRRLLEEQRLLDFTEVGLLHPAELGPGGAMADEGGGSGKG